MSQTEYFDVWVPGKIVGFNQAYGITCKGGKARMYLTPAAIEWKRGAGLLIGEAINAKHDFEFDPNFFYEITVYFHSNKRDVDSPIKLVIDTIAEKAGINDFIFCGQSSRRRPQDELEGEGLLIKVTRSFWGPNDDET